MATDVTTADDRAAAIAEKLDKEISSLKDQVASLRRTIQVEASTILASAPAQKSLQNARPSKKPLKERAAAQQAHMQQCLHRTVNPVTAFKVVDPDPSAVDEGHVLGLRFEVMSRGQFLQPYFVMLNRPYRGSRRLRIHRHTVPPAIPLAGLAARHLPPPSAAKSGSAGEEAPEQDLDRFVRALRRDITRYHNRLGVAADLRRDLGLQDRAAAGDDAPTRDGSEVVDVGITDVEGKHLTITWADERSGRLVMDEDGVVQRLMVFGQGGRDWETTRGLFSPGDRVEDVAKKLVAF